MDILNYNFGGAVSRIKYFDAQPHPADQSWYGLDQPLKQWAGLPAGLPLLLSTHHGAEVMLEDLPTHTGSRNPIIVARADFQAFYQQKHGKQAFRAGCPYVLHRRMNGIAARPDARGTLAFPAHSTHHIRAEFDVHGYIDQLLSLPEAFQPVSACLYWKDILLGRAQPFLDRGIPVLTSGHMFDPAFCKTFYGIMQNFRYTTSNNILVTNPVLSIEMGIPAFYLGDALLFQDDGQDPNRQIGDHSEYDTLQVCQDPLAMEYYSLFPRYRPGMGPDDIQPSARLQEIVSLIHACDELTDPTAVRAAIFQAYALFHPKGKAYLKIVAENVPLLQTGQYEAAFAELPDMLDFCRVICRYPDLVFQR